MKIIRAGTNDIDVFSESELSFGACCFFTGDKLHRYFFEIDGREATLFTNTKLYIPQAIDEFLYYSGFIASIKDKEGNILLTRTPNTPYLCEINKLQPSQFYINEKKLENCKKWIKRPEDIFVPITMKDRKTILLDGHTRVRAAIDLGYTAVYVYPDKCDVGSILAFVEESIRRQINNVSDMELLSDEAYELKWRSFCNNFFKHV